MFAYLHRWICAGKVSRWWALIKKGKCPCSGPNYSKLLMCFHIYIKFGRNKPSRCLEGTADRAWSSFSVILTGRGAGLANVGQRAVDWLLGLVPVLPQQDKADVLSELRGDHPFLYLAVNDVIWKNKLQGKPPCQAVPRYNTEYIYCIIPE